ncbi:hypothetical protein [Gloeocapsa sp. PCC 73106]|uniref:hypothetical protein n=1 Tax=Gloeocapsa sp. PCC 73106 TaxID=102232 RepID=UPI0002ACF96B|nr:hypothetical protein [Gloeocapsa sp. PCC 73106]ELR96655.1 hypothetical protein GLO73106DRAFT_00004510 [Gloeocapsa sp. PCC 73106]
MSKLTDEIKKVGSLTLFFLVCFGYILLMLKLFLAEYKIDVYVFSKTIISALVAAKAVAIMDMTPMLNYYSESPRYLRVLYKTFIYTSAVFVIAVLEKLFHAYRETKALGSALELFLETRNLNNFLAVTLCVSVVFLIHNIFHEIDKYLGKGSLRKLFFNRS